MRWEHSHNFLTLKNNPPPLSFPFYNPPWPRGIKRIVHHPLAFRLGPSLTAPRIPFSCVAFLFLALGGVLDEQHGHSGCLGNNIPEFQPQLSSVPAAES